MTANVQIIEAHKAEVVTIPMMAIVRKQQKTFVTVVKSDNTTEDRGVTLGINDGENVEVTSGLSGDEQVLVHKTDSNSVWSAASIARRMPAMGMPGRR